MTMNNNLTNAMIFTFPSPNRMEIMKWYSVFAADRFSAFICTTPGFPTVSIAKAYFGKG
jgi:hypothetical protein